MKPAYAGLALAFLSTLAVSSPAFGSPEVEGTVLALHVTGKLKNMGCLPNQENPAHGTNAVLPCGYQVQWNTGISWGGNRPYVWLMVANAPQEQGIAGISCGIEWGPVQSDPGEQMVVSWTRCSDLEFPMKGWPASGGGNRIIWASQTNCQRQQPDGLVCTAVAGFFYVTSYYDYLIEAAYMRITENKSVVPSELLYARCDGTVSSISGQNLGSAGFNPSSTSILVPGFNPLAGVCPLVVTVRQTGAPIKCNGWTTTVSVSATGGTPPYSGVGTFNNVGGGLHVYSVQDSQHRVASGSITILEPARLVLSEVHADAKCSGAAGGWIDLTVSGGTPGYVYYWSNYGITQDISHLKAGTYSVLVVDANQCTASLSVTVGASGATPSITASAGPGGAINPDGVIHVACGTDQSFAVTADTCHAVNEILVDGLPVALGPGGTYTFVNVIDDHTISATFGPRHAITATATSGGTIVPAGTIAVPCGGDTTLAFTFTPDPNHRIQDVVVDGVSLGPRTSYTFMKAREDHTIHVIFESLPSAVAGPALALHLTGKFSNMGCGATQDNPAQGAAAVSPCAYVVRWNTGIGPAPNRPYVWLMVGNVPAATGIAGLSCGIEWGTVQSDPGEQMIVSWTRCSDLDFPMNGWPAPGGGNRITWDPRTHCQRKQNDGVTCTAVAGFFYVTSYDDYLIESAYLRITENKNVVPAELLYSGCDAGERAIPKENLGSVGVNPTPSTILVPGFNPLLTQCLLVAEAHQLSTIPCSGGATTVSVSATGGTPPYSGVGNYYVRAGTTTYSVRDSKGQVASVSITITEPAPLVLSEVHADVGCGGERGWIDLTVFGGTPGYTYSWSPGGGTTEDVLDVGAGAYSVTVTDAHACRATLKVTIAQGGEIPVITASAGPGGTIRPVGLVSVPCGSDQTFAVTADSCYAVNQVVVDGMPVQPEPGGTHTFTNVVRDHTISATFTLVEGYTITANASPGGTISPAGIIEVPCYRDTTVTFTCTPDAGGQLVDVVVDGASLGPLESYTFAHVRANHTLYVRFSEPNVAALLSYFAATPVPGGIEIRWKVSDPDWVSHVVLERRGTERDAWVRVFEGTRGEDAVVDREGVADGFTYLYRLTGRTRSGSDVVLGEISATAGAAVALSPVWPNPTTGLAHVRFSLARESHVRVRVLDLSGREVAIVAEGLYPAGAHQAIWNGTLPNGAPAPSGVYFVQFRSSAGENLAQRLVLSR